MAPVLLIGARMSQRSARGWARFAPGLMRGMLESLSLVSAQDTASEARLLALGLPGARMLPALMLKSRAAMAQVAAGGGVPALATTGFPPRARCLLAASTHAGEDAPILDAFAQARAAGVFDLLILAPRHPRRAPDIAALIAARGLAFATRSAGEPPGPQTVVYLADTLGEMRQWYARAGATVIGGTLQDHGGHTPFEPAATGSAIVHGPHVANFAESFAALDTAGAALAVGCGTSLGPALITLGRGSAIPAGHRGPGRVAARRRRGRADRGNPWCHGDDHGAMIARACLLQTRAFMPLRQISHLRSGRIWACADDCDSMMKRSSASKQGRISGYAVTCE